METIALTFLVAMVALAVIVTAAAWSASKATDLLVGGKHRLLEGITSTGEVPEKWRRGFDRRIARLRTREGRSDTVRSVQERAKTTYLRRLARLIDYASKSTLVADEATRRVLLDRMKAARTYWEATPAEKL